MVAASAALADRQHVQKVRVAVANERKAWHTFLEDHSLPHTQSEANFVFFDAGRPHDSIAKPMRERGVQVARAFAPYSNWVRITIGTPTENEKARAVLSQILKHSVA